MAIIKNIPIGITFPLRDGSAGYFEQSTDSFTAYRMNIINLLRTHQGERRLNPTFGSRLGTLVFEPNDSFLMTKIQNIIQQDVAEWIPGVTVTNVSVQGTPNTNTDNNTLYISVTYTVNSINVSDVVEIELNVNKV